MENVFQRFIVLRNLIADQSISEHFSNYKLLLDDLRFELFTVCIGQFCLMGYRHIYELLFKWKCRIRCSHHHLTMFTVISGILRILFSFLSLILFYGRIHILLCSMCGFSMTSLVDGICFFIRAFIQWTSFICSRGYRKNICANFTWVNASLQAWWQVTMSD